MFADCLLEPKAASSIGSLLSLRIQNVHSIASSSTVTSTCVSFFASIGNSQLLWEMFSVRP